MKIEERKLSQMAASFFMFWQQDKTAHHSPETAINTLNLSYSHAVKPYSMLER